MLYPNLQLKKFEAKCRTHSLIIRLSSNFLQQVDIDQKKKPTLNKLRPHTLLKIETCYLEVTA